MDKTQILDDVKNIIASHFGAEVEGLNEDTRLREVQGWDSLGHMTFIGAVEEKFGIKFSFAEVISLTTIKSVVSCVEKRI